MLGHFEMPAMVFCGYLYGSLWPQSYRAYPLQMDVLAGEVNASVKWGCC